MKVMEEQWINNLRARFADRKQPAPDGLWESIEAAMTGQKAAADSGTKPAKRAKTLPLWRRKAVAAAACLVVMAGITGWLMTRTDGDEPTVTGLTGGGTVVSVVSGTGDNGRGRPAPSEEQQNLATQIVNRLTAFAGKRADETVAIAAHEEQLLSMNDTETAPTTVFDGAEESGGEKHGNKAQDHKATAVKAGDNKPYTVRRPAKLPRTARNGKHNGVSFGLYGMGLASISGSSASVSSLGYSSGMLSDVYFNDASDFLPNASESVRVPVLSAEDVSVKHRQPVKAGLVARFQLDSRLGVESGLYYTYLSSDFVNSASMGGYRTEQRLHYVGVPLKMTCSLWRNDRIDVYAGAGGAVEIGVGGSSHTDYLEDGEVQRSEDDDAKDTRPQFSVNASAGVQYNFNSTVGAFLEPGVSYYINNGSQVQNFYKDKPWSLNLSLGLRFTVK